MGTWKGIARQHTVYACCMNYMDAYEMEGTVFVNKYDNEDTALAFDGYQAYTYTPGQETP